MEVHKMELIKCHPTSKLNSSSSSSSRTWWCECSSVTSYSAHSWKQSHSGCLDCIKWHPHVRNFGLQHPQNICKSCKYLKHSCTWWLDDTRGRLCRAPPFTSSSNSHSHLHWNNDDLFWLTGLFFFLFFFSTRLSRCGVLQCANDPI